MGIEKRPVSALASLVIVAFLAAVAGCSTAAGDSADQRSVPRGEKWGIYALDLATQEVQLIYDSPRKIEALRVNGAGDRFAFSQRVDGEGDEYAEICTIRADGSDFKRLTTNLLWDLYPTWAPGDSQIAFLSWRDTDLDIFVMESDGTNVRGLFDSGSHDADIDWRGDTIAFTTHSQIWSIRGDGTELAQITDPPKAGQWGNANLPFGDYDPRLSPDGTTIVFERLEDDSSPHGNYNIYAVNRDGTGEAQLTDTGYSQGFANWAHSGDRMVYLVAAIGSEGKYDIYMMNSDGTDSHNITPEYFPADFLCHSPHFSPDDAKIYFVGEWWQ